MQPGGHASNSGGGSSSAGERIASVRKRSCGRSGNGANYSLTRASPLPASPPHTTCIRSQILTGTKGTCKVSEDAVTPSERQNSTGGKGVSTPSPAGLRKAIESAPKDATKTEQAQQRSSERKLTESVGKAASVRAQVEREASANEELPQCT